MTPAQLKLARWLAGSDAWRVWCEEHPDERIPSAYLPDLDLSADLGAQPFARFWLRFNDVYGPRLDTSRLVGPLIGMLPTGALQRTRPGTWTLTRDRQAMTGHGDTDAEALCALLKEVTE